MNAFLRVRLGAEGIQGGSWRESENALVLDGGETGITKKLVNPGGRDIMPEDEEIDESEGVKLVKRTVHIVKTEDSV